MFRLYYIDFDIFKMAKDFLPSIGIVMVMFGRQQYIPLKQMPTNVPYA